MTGVHFVSRLHLTHYSPCTAECFDMMSKLHLLLKNSTLMVANDFKWIFINESNDLSYKSVAITLLYDRGNYRCFLQLIDEDKDMIPLSTKGDRVSLLLSEL